uniref:uncharacterized protein LOC109953725 n=1 Tax=Monopterus albus TaxID=43700 RepID=UPI0009B2FF51|nr:uncharacterized protein LOC109953725 [Monopterus albus]
MSNHLQYGHGVLNLQERQLLLNLASNRVNRRLQACPVCNYNTTRLDQHIPICHMELSEAQIQHYLQWGMRVRTIAFLQELRATDPAVPLASSLALGLEEEEEGGHQQGPRDMTKEPQCDNPDCVAQRRRWQQFAMEEEQRTERFEEELRKLRGMHRKMAKDINRLSKTPVKTKRQINQNLMVRLSPLQSAFNASRRALRAARRAANNFFGVLLRIIDVRNWFNS